MAELSGPVRRRALGALALLAPVIVLAACGGGQGMSGSTTTTSALHGLIPSPLPRKPSFTLLDTTGRPYSFASRTRGKLTYLYFGYTHCPDVCPTTMGDLAAALHHQPESVRRRIEVVFVTVDPRRDTGRVLRAWLDHFDRPFVGLRGSEKQIRAAEQAAGVPLAPPERVKGAKYAVQHSALVLPYSPDNRAHVLYTQGFHTADYAHDIPRLLAFATSGDS